MRVRGVRGRWEGASDKRAPKLKKKNTTHSQTFSFFVVLHIRIGVMSSFGVGLNLDSRFAVKVTAAGAVVIELASAKAASAGAPASTGAPAGAGAPAGGKGKGGGAKKGPSATAAPGAAVAAAAPPAPVPLGEDGKPLSKKEQRILERQRKEVWCCSLLLVATAMCGKSVGLAIVSFLDAPVPPFCPILPPPLLLFQAEAKSGVAASSGDASLFGDLPMIRSTEITDRRWTRCVHGVASRRLGPLCATFLCVCGGWWRWSCRFQHPSSHLTAPWLLALLAGPLGPCCLHVLPCCCCLLHVVGGWGGGGKAVWGLVVQDCLECWSVQCTALLGWVLFAAVNPAPLHPCVLCVCVWS
jgi:hypothetical protein